MTTSAEAYSLEDHHHRFAAWAAARAAQRGLAGGSHALLVAAIEVCGVAEILRNRADLDPGWTAQKFDRAHTAWRRSIVDHLHRNGVKSATFGRAAKLIAIYLKSTVVLSGGHDTALGRVLHPPIDAVLLRVLAADDLNFSVENRRFWRSTRWTSLEEEGYRELIASFREEGLDQPAFWMIERYWTPNGRSSKATPLCPSCGSTQVVPIVHGMPTPEAEELAALGEVVPGGCMVAGDGSDPEWRCKGCAEEFVEATVAVGGG